MSQNPLNQLNKDYRQEIKVTLAKLPERIRRASQLKDEYRLFLSETFGPLTGEMLADIYVSNPRIRPLIEDHMTFNYAPQGSTPRFSPRGVREFAEHLYEARKAGKMRGRPGLNSWIRDLVELEKTGRTR